MAHKSPRSRPHIEPVVSQLPELFDQSLNDSHSDGFEAVGMIRLMQ